MPVHNKFGITISDTMEELQPDYFYTNPECMHATKKKKGVVFSPTVDVLNISREGFLQIKKSFDKSDQDVVSISSCSESELTDVSERTRSKSKFKFIPIDNAPSSFFVSSSTVLEETVYIIDSSDSS